jgi:Phage portal protein
VPAHLVGIGQPPTYNNIEALNQQYYSQCLQSLIESIELLLDEGLELPKPLGTEFELDGLLRMDTKTKTEAARQAIQSGVSPNEIRRSTSTLALLPVVRRRISKSSNGRCGIWPSAPCPANGRLLSRSRCQQWQTKLRPGRSGRSDRLCASSIASPIGNA